MKKTLFIICLFISANLFAQEKNEYFVKNNGDTVYCKIDKIYYLDVRKKTTDKKNSIDYIKDDKSLKNVSFDSIIGYKKNNENFRFKKTVGYFVKKMAQYQQKSFYFLPNNDGRYFKKGDTYVVCNKSGNTRFYNFPDYNNTSYFGTPSSNGGVSAGIYYASASTPSLLFVEKNNDGIIYQIMTVEAGDSNERLGWSELKEYCSDDASIVSLSDEYYKEDKRCSTKNMAKVIEQYTGKKFKELPQINAD